MTPPADASPPEPTPPTLRKVHPHTPGDARSQVIVCGGSGLKPEAEAELKLFATWLTLEREGRPTFAEWCKLPRPL